MGASETLAPIYAWREERTRAYVARRTAEGKSKKEIIRCLKRYIAREIYRILSSLSLRKPSISAP